MFEAMEKIEVEMTLIGATAIEDKLQVFWFLQHYIAPSSSMILDAMKYIRACYLNAIYMQS